MTHIEVATITSARYPCFVAGSLTARWLARLLTVVILATAVLQIGPVAAEQEGSITSAGPSHPYVPTTKVAADACPSGLVWRERFDGDTVCVLPGERDANRRKRHLQGCSTLCTESQMQHHSTF